MRLRGRWRRAHGRGVEWGCADKVFIHEKHYLIKLFHRLKKMNKAAKASGGALR